LRIWTIIIYWHYLITLLDWIRSLDKFSTFFENILKKFWIIFLPTNIFFWDTLSIAPIIVSTIEWSSMSTLCPDCFWISVLIISCILRLISEQSDVRRLTYESRVLFFYLVYLYLPLYLECIWIVYLILLMVPMKLT